MKKKKQQKSIEELIEEEYLLHNDDEDDETYWTKEALQHALNKVQRKIFITYLEQDATYTTTAKLLKVSVPTLKKYINNLKTLITEYICKHLS